MNMGLIALFIGLPVTLALMGLGVGLIILANKICTNNSIIPFKSFVIWLFCIPLNMVIALEAGGMYTAISTWFKKDGLEIGYELIMTPIMAFFIGTFNVIEPMKMPMGKPEEEAKKLAQEIISEFGFPESKYYSNGNWAKRESWNPLTESTFDAGIIITGKNLMFFCIWFQDED